MSPDCMIHPDHAELIITQMLDDALPGVTWNEGHSGVVLKEEQAEQIGEMWKERMFVG